MKTIEQDSRLPAWLNAILNMWPLCRDMNDIKSWAWAWDASGPYNPGTVSLFYNGYVMIRLTNVGIFVHIKPIATGRFQCGIGWALNGRFKILFRIQSDIKAALGDTGPNLGQASAWQRGTA